MYLISLKKRKPKNYDLGIKKLGKKLHRQATLIDLFNLLKNYIRSVEW